MKIRIVFFTPELNLAAVHVEPNWLEWIFGAREMDEVARSMYPGEWVWDRPFGGPVPWHVSSALNRASNIESTVKR